MAVYNVVKDCTWLSRFYSVVQGCTLFYNVVQGCKTVVHDCTQLYNVLQGCTWFTRMYTVVRGFTQLYMTVQRLYNICTTYAQHMFIVVHKSFNLVQLFQ